MLVPAGVVAQTTRGGRGDVLINRLLKRAGVHVTVHDERRARIAGTLLAESSTEDAIDALVVAEAVERGGAIIATSDPSDIRNLASERPQIDVFPI